MLQIGVVYQSDEGLHLALGPDLLVTVASGRPAYRRMGVGGPHVQGLTEITDLPVADLCARWGLSTEELGAITDPYFIPEEGGKCIAQGRRSAYLGHWLSLWTRRARTGGYDPSRSAGTPRRRGGRDPRRGRLLLRGSRGH